MFLTRYFSKPNTMNSPNVCIGRTQDFLPEGRGFDHGLWAVRIFVGDVLHVCFKWIGGHLLEKKGFIGGYETLDQG